MELLLITSPKCVFPNVLLATEFTIMQIFTLVGVYKHVTLFIANTVTTQHKLVN